MRAMAALRGSGLAHIETDVEGLFETWELACLERQDRQALVALGALGAIEGIFAALTDMGPMEPLIGPVVQRIGNDPSTAFRVTRTQLRSLGLYLVYEPERAEVGRAVLVRGAVEGAADAWRSSVDESLETHVLAVEDHRALVSDESALAVVATIADRLASNGPAA